jgi:hypothetical protein
VELSTRHVGLRDYFRYTPTSQLTPLLRTRRTDHTLIDSFAQPPPYSLRFISYTLVSHSVEVVLQYINLADNSCPHQRWRKNTISVMQNILTAEEDKATAMHAAITDAIQTTSSYTTLQETHIPPKGTP